MSNHKSRIARLEAKSRPSKPKARTLVMTQGDDGLFTCNSVRGTQEELYRRFQPGDIDTVVIVTYGWQSRIQTGGYSATVGIDLNRI